MVAIRKVPLRGLIFSITHNFSGSYVSASRRYRIGMIKSEDRYDNVGRVTKVCRGIEEPYAIVCDTPFNNVAIQAMHSLTWAQQYAAQYSIWSNTNLFLSDMSRITLAGHRRMMDSPFGFMDRYLLETYYVSSKTTALIPYQSHRSREYLGSHFMDYFKENPKPCNSLLQTQLRLNGFLHTPVRTITAISGITKAELSPNNSLQEKVNHDIEEYERSAPPGNSRFGFLQKPRQQQSLSLRPSGIGFA